MLRYVHCRSEWLPAAPGVESLGPCAHAFLYFLFVSHLSKYNQENLLEACKSVIHFTKERPVCSALRS